MTRGNGGYRPVQYAAILILGLLMLIIPGRGRADCGGGAAIDRPPLILDDVAVSDTGPLDIYDHMDVLIDGTGAITIDDILAGRSPGPFRAVAGNLSCGHITSQTWVRLQLRLPASFPHDVGIPPWMLQLGPLYLNHVDIYTISARRMRHMAYGDSDATGPRPYRGREFMVPLDFDNGDTLTVYLRIRTSSATTLDGTISPAFTAIDTLSAHSLWLGTYIGIALAMMVANLIYGLWLRDKSALSYCAHVVTLAGVAGGRFNILADLMPAPWAALLANGTHNISTALAITTTTVMTNIMLNMRANFPRLYWLSWPLGIVPGLIAVPLALFPHDITLISPLFNVLAIIVMVQNYACTLIMAVRGNRVAQLMAVSFSPSTVASVIGVFSRLKIVPYNAALEDWFQVAGALNLILMNTAIAYRIRHLERDRQSALSSALNASQSVAKRAKEQITLRTRELATSNAKLNQALTAERRAVKEKLQFIDMISHEYRTPVAILRTAIDVLSLHGGGMPPGVPANLFGRMGQAVRRLVDIIEVGLRAEPPDTTTEALLRTSVDLAIVVEDAVSAAQEEYPDRVITVEGPETLPLHGDPALLTAAVTHLLQNALRYSPPATAVQVEIVALDEGAQVRITDQGIGIPAADREHVFQKFTRLPQTQHIPGTGMGLFLARRIAELHKGGAYIDPHHTGGCRTILQFDQMHRE